MVTELSPFEYFCIMSGSLRCGRFTLSLERPLIMGIVNVTPDSFSDGGQFLNVDAALAHARQLIAQGADIIDIGGESTRPGAREVTLEEERQRVLPVLARLAGESIPVSIDTQKPELMRDAVAAGASMINDVNALQASGAIAVVAASNVAVCVMHKRGTPADMQRDPRYENVMDEVYAFLDQRVRTLRAAGVDIDRIVVDPGFGFGKTLEHNLALLRQLQRLSAMRAPIMAGISRKAILGRITGREASERVYASVAAALVAVKNGAAIVRVHDVAATRDALAVWSAVESGI